MAAIPSSPDEDTGRTVPGAFQTLGVSIDPGHVVTVLINCPAKTVNAISQLMLAELSIAVSSFERELPTAVIFASAKPRSFIVGADLFEIRKMNTDQLTEYLANGQKVFSRIEKLSCSTVAAINGTCLGGGLELALACKVRVAADDADVRIGLPEVKLGIIPGWGGTVRLPRLVGMLKALPLLVEGTALTAIEAKLAGLIDDVASMEELPAAARRMASRAAAFSENQKSHSRVGESSVANQQVLDALREKLLQKNAEGSAAIRLIDTVRLGCETGCDGGFDAERQALVELINTEESRRLMDQFFLKRRGQA